MIKTFKTKEEVTVDARLKIQAHVFVDISDVNYNGVAFYGTAMYYYKNENGDRVNMPTVPPACFTRAEANALASMGALPGDTFCDQFDQLIIRATTYQFNSEQYFELSGSDWEIYEEEVPEAPEE